MTIKAKVEGLAKEYWRDTVQIRRHIHQHPELSYQEEQTAAYVASELDKLGISYQSGVGGYGLVASIGEDKGRGVIALRADMDALPIKEANEVPYKSKTEGVMHACGHDVHTSSLLGTARILKTLEDQLPGQVRLLFQPGEEKLPGGATLMIRDGALQNPIPLLIFGQHVHPPLESGTVGFCPGNYMASADEIYLTVKGRGGHGALPQDCIDPIAITAQIISTLQQVVSRYAPPTVPTVLTFGKINSDGGATNVIPNAVFLEGTFRTMDEAWREEAHKRIRKIASSVAKGMGGAIELDLEKGYPVLYNHPDLTSKAKFWSEEYLGASQVVDLPIRMTAEDFSWYSHHIPACFYRLGTGNKAKGITSPVHTDTFDIDEAALQTSIGLMSWLSFKALSKNA